VADPDALCWHVSQKALYFSLHQERVFQTRANLPIPGKVAPEKGMRPFGNERGSAMLLRRQFLMGVTATALCAPAIVRAESLMPIKGAVLLPDIRYFGFVDRLYVHINLPPILTLQQQGRTAHEIAATMKASAMNGRPWDAHAVMAVIERDRIIRRDDARRREERQLVAA
jgi:hypothetical protein